MPRLRTVIVLLFAALLIPSAIATSASADQGGAPNDNAAFGQSHKVCAQAPAGQAACDAIVVTDAKGKPAATAGPTGLAPADLAKAYNLPTGNGSGQTVAIVDAYDSTYALSDINVYRAQFPGIPALQACPANSVSTPGGPCIKKVNQSGATSPLPNTNRGWSEEIGLDLDMVSAVCPNCNILLVEANSSSMNDLAAAVTTAAGLGATEISNSYGGNEFSGESSFDSAYNPPNVRVTVSTGDSGYGAEYPATSPFVTAVGGTSLTRSSTASRGFTESAWSGAGSGCSAYETSGFQGSANTQCARRAVADVSAVANPYTGVSVYNTVDGGWVVYGGTSVSSPIIAGVYALAGNGASVTNAVPYAHPSYSGSSQNLFDVTSGSNGRCARVPAQWCRAGTGWDGPTGLGTPDGTGAF